MYNVDITLKIERNTTMIKKTLTAVAVICMAICFASCSSDEGSSTAQSGIHSSVAGVATKLGEGETTFELSVTYPDSKTECFTISTDKETVGDALYELSFIEGDETELGLYVKTVNGVTVDFDDDGKYWAFYINGEYAMTGVDSTDIDADCAYAFKAE